MFFFKTVCYYEKLKIEKKINKNKNENKDVYKKIKTRRKANFRYPPPKLNTFCQLRVNQTSIYVFP